ncbi:conserved hypothetical protein [Streptomyces sviceus ATCC 29083]|uniref:Uncharacterized protein n=1 Tax=Streptomyces sviceus (strain ATCC 29083 / DSM 924 / JCM 4929 / NBRC 13980 / NCIMB 11184 / NRRL 5439 / UC 5370) TaxID=463191 RepID=B5I2P8_STRX2|nr:conserved hypothetical protein [Streptomyces sviceus ATCC 29083]
MFLLPKGAGDRPGVRLTAPAATDGFQSPASLSTLGAPIDVVMAELATRLAPMLAGPANTLPGKCH